MQEHGVLVGRWRSAMYSSHFPTWCQALRGPSLHGVSDFVSLKLESVSGKQLSLAIDPELLGCDNHMETSNQALFFPQSSSHHACHQLVLPEGEPGTHFRAGIKKDFSPTGRKRRGGRREGHLLVWGAPQNGYLWDSSFPVTPSDCSGKRRRGILGKH